MVGCRGRRCVSLLRRLRASGYRDSALALGAPDAFPVDLRGHFKLRGALLALNLHYLGDKYFGRKKRKADEIKSALENLFEIRFETTLKNLTRNRTKARTRCFV